MHYAWCMICFLALAPHVNFATNIPQHCATQHLRLTLEPLPVGLIEVSELGEIEWIDDWTTLKLGFKCEQLRGRSITLLFVDSTSEFLAALKERQYGCLMKDLLRTGSGQVVAAEIVLKPTLQLHKFVCSVIFTTEDSAKAVVR